MSTDRVIGIVSNVTGRFVCRICQCEVEMVAIIDARSVKDRIWREVSEHDCAPLPNVHPHAETVVDANGDYFWDVVAAGKPPSGPKS